MSREGLRRLLHAGTVVILALPFVTSWETARLVLAAATPLVLLFETARLRIPSIAQGLDTAVPAFRPRERARVSGPVWLWLGYAVAAWMPPLAATGGILAGALADPAASAVGTRWGRGAPKSWAGSAAAAVAATLALGIVGIGWPRALSAGLVAAAVERWSGPVDDNLAVAPAVAAWLLLVS